MSSNAGLGVGGGLARCWVGAGFQGYTEAVVVDAVAHVGYSVGGGCALDGAHLVYGGGA